MNNESLKRLAEEMEGGLYVHLWVAPNTGAFSFFVRKDWYTVKDGVVHVIEGTNLSPTNDTLIHTKTVCRCVGKYVEGREYKRKTNYIKYADLQNRLFK